MLTFKILDNGTLRIFPDDAEAKVELQEQVDSMEKTHFDIFMDATEGYWTNGWGVYTGEQLHQMSDAPVICDDATIEDDGSILLYGHVWVYTNYMLYSMIEIILRDGFVDIPLFDMSDGDKYPPVWA